VSARGHLPAFIDARGARCAVAHLVELTAGSALAQDLDRRYHHAYIEEVDAAELEGWIAESGFSRDELAMIQPAYPPEPPPPAGGPDLELKLAADFRYAGAREGAPTDPAHIAALRTDLRWNLPHNYYLGTPVLRLDGGVGWTRGEGLAYAAHARLGLTWIFWPVNGHAHHAGLVGGFGADALGDLVPRAWTVPLEAFYYVRTSQRTRMGLLGGPTFAVVGAERPLGWSGALDLVWREALGHEWRFAPRDLDLALAVHRLSRMTFVGVSVGVTGRDRYGEGTKW
jgi:hypothetical protein